MRFDEFNEGLDKTHKAAIKGMHRLSGDQYYGLYKTMNDVAGHDGKKQTAPSGGTDDEVSDKPFAYAYTDEEKAMIKAADPKAKRITSSKSEEVKEGVVEGSGLDKFRQRVNSQGFTDSPEERNDDRLERKRRHQDALNRISDIGGGSSDEERAHQAQQRMARDEYKLDRLKRNDDDWENTFDMMRDRMNRYQWSSQRDVDPEQLAAISNIKYEPRKKNESFPAGIQQSWTNRSDASYTPGKPMPQSLSKKMSPGKPSGVQAKTDDELLAYYAQRKAEKEKEKQSQQGVAEDASANYIWIQGDFDGDTTASGAAQGSSLDSQSTQTKLYRGRMSNVRPLTSPPLASGNTIKVAKIPLTLDVGNKKFSTTGIDLQLTMSPNGYISQGEFGRVRGTAIVKIMPPGSEPNVSEAGNNYHANRTGFRQQERDTERHDIDINNEYRAVHGTWYVRIDGLIQPTPYKGKAAANAAALELKKQPGNENKLFMLTTKA